MPIYEYSCDSCGLFDSLHSIKERNNPQSCPECGLLSERIISVPRLQTMELSRVRAFEVNERSQHEPKHHNSSGHVHKDGCCGSGKKSGRTREIKQRDGTTAKSFPSARPWMISH